MKALGEYKLDYNEYVKLDEAQILSIDEQRGVCSLKLLDNLNVRVDNVAITAPYVSLNGSGMRFMPDVNDYCIVGFTLLGSVEIIAYKLKNFVEMMTAGVDGVVDLNNVKHNWFFRKLKRGEISITGLNGLSEVFLARDGSLILNSKNSFIALDANGSRIYTLSGLNEGSFSEVYVKAGRVERIIGTVKSVFYALGGIAREYSVVVKRLGSMVFQFIIGDVFNAEGVPQVSSKGLPLVKLEQDNVNYYKKVDNASNEDKSANMVTENYVSQVKTCQTSYEVDSPSIVMNGQVVLGAKTSADPAVLGNEMQTTLMAINTTLIDIQSLLTSMSTQLGIPTGSNVMGVGQGAYSPIVAKILADIQIVSADINLILSKKVTLV